MRAVDTNVVVRYLVIDDDDQFRRARAVFAGGDVFLATTVILETEWVLRGTYRFDSMSVVTALRSLSGLPSVTSENPEQLNAALQWTEAGMDFADALHLAQTKHCAAFVTFDRKLTKIGRNLTGIDVVEP